MFDFQATLKWITEVLKDPNAAAAAYREASAPWLNSFMQITLPVYVAAFIVGLIIAAITGGTFMFGSLSVGVFVFSLLWALAWTFVIAFIFDFLAGVFDGQRNFDAAYAVVALAIIPSAIGSAIGPLPWLGWLISLAASIYSLVLAYRFIPMFLEIPEESRVKHFVVSIIAAIVVNILVSVVMGSMFATSSMMQGAMQGATQRAEDGTTSVEPSGTGIFGGLERQANYADAAAKDTYQPPANGRLQDAQVKRYADNLRKTAELRERLGKKLEVLDEDKPSISDVFSGIGGTVRMGTAEMEVIKTAGGNWAEHQWVRGQIETARIQQDLNETTAHNYQLFQEYQERIEQYE